MRPIYFILFISVFYAVGIGLLIYGLIAARRSAVAAGWPTAPGTVVRCSLDAKSDGDGNDTYQVKVEYDSAIGAKPYSGSRVAFGYGSSTGWDAHNQIFQALRTARSIRVRYDPADPSRSTLSYGLHRSLQFVLTFAVTWLMFVIGFTVIWWVAQQPDNVLVRNMLLKGRPPSSDRRVSTPSRLKSRPPTRGSHAPQVRNRLAGRRPSVRHPRRRRRLRRHLPR